MNQVSASIPAITGFGTAMGAAGAGLTAAQGFMDIASSGVVLPTLGIIATDYAAAYETAHLAHSAGYAALILQLEDAAARAAATAASYVGTETANTVSLAKEGSEC